MMTDRPARLYGLRDRGRVGRGLARRPGGVRPGDRSPAGRPRLLADLPGGGERLYAESTGVDARARGRDARWSRDGVVTGEPSRHGAALGARHRDGDPGRRGGLTPARSTPGRGQEPVVRTGTAAGAPPSAADR